MASVKMTEYEKNIRSRGTHDPIKFVKYDDIVIVSKR